MLHQTVKTDCAQALPQTSSLRLAVGDLIRWPLADTPDAVALVVDVEMVAGRQVLTVVPGALDQAQAVRPDTLRVTRADEMRQAGLNRPMRFAVDARIAIAVAHPVLAGAGQPMHVGRLGDGALERLHALRARMQALRDIAASRREARRADRRGDTRTGWWHMPRPARPRDAQEGRQ